MHHFQSSLAYGQAREAAFHTLFPKLTRTDGRICDFLTPNGNRLELKAEKRASSETPNIAVELHSSKDRPGALYNAWNNHVKYFVYMFSDARIFIYDTNLLYDFISKHKHDFKKAYIRNSTYTSTVIIVPRAVVQCLEYETFE